MRSEERRGPSCQAKSASSLADQELHDRYGEWAGNLIWIARDHRRRSAEEQERRQRRVTERQRELRRAAENGPRETAAWLRKQLRLEEAEKLTIKAPELPRPLSADEFIQPPLELEREIGEALSGEVAKQEAARPWFWLLCHIAWLESGYLPGDTRRAFCWSSTATGKIAETEQLEAETRNFLRRTGGIERVRGKVSVLSDCPMSRAWWRYHLACEAAHTAAEAGGSALDTSAAHRGLHWNRPPIWEELVGLSVKRLTAINQDRARAAIVSALAQTVADADDDGRIEWRKGSVARAAKELAREALVRSLAQIAWPELRRIVAAAATQERAIS